MKDEQQTSPRPLRMAEAEDPPREGWEFSAIPWTFGIDEAQTLGDGWEPIGVAYITPRESTLGECCLIVRRPL